MSILNTLLGNELFIISLIFSLTTLVSVGSLHYILHRKSKNLEFFLNSNLRVISEAFGLDLTLGKRENASLRANTAKQVQAGERILTESLLDGFPEIDLVDQGAKMMGVDFNLKRTLKKMPPASILGLLTKYYPMLPADMRERLGSQLPHLNPEMMTQLANQGMNAINTASTAKKPMFEETSLTEG